LVAKPLHGDEYAPETLDLIHSTCLYLATKLGDLLEDLVVVGGLVPSLLADQMSKESRSDLHVGTVDLDLGLSVAVLDGQRYHAIRERLVQAGFERDENDQGNKTSQRWRSTDHPLATVDFLIGPSHLPARGGNIQHLSGDFAAIVTPGLDLAFIDRSLITLKGRTIQGEVATRSIWVCGPGAFTVLKALAFSYRGENKDAYDLYYVLKYHGGGLIDIASRISAFGPHAASQEALGILRDDFCDIDRTGPRRVAEFLAHGPDDEIQRDVVGHVVRLLSSMTAPSPSERTQGDIE
jgi:hypothetical protein